jgi:cell division protein FtsB
MSDDFLNDLLTQIDTQRVQIDQYQSNNQKLTNENKLLKQKVEDL